jgi:formate dehydrogenase major subunit
MFDSSVTTTCGYCGGDCRLEAHTRDGKVATIAPATDGPANEGHTCLKGQFSRRRDRLTTPLIREHGEFRIATWEAALHRIKTELTRIKALVELLAQYTPEAVQDITGIPAEDLEEATMLPALSSG